jgi:hypothetical protein
MMFEGMALAAQKLAEGLAAMRSRSAIEELNLWSQTMRRVRGTISKKQPYGRILFTKRVGDVEMSYHATKGWRVRRG